MPKSTKEAAVTTAKKAAATRGLYGMPHKEFNEHLKQAEFHLIKMVELLAKSSGPKRSDRFINRMRYAQETITSLRMEELVILRNHTNRTRSAAKSIRRT